MMLSHLPAGLAGLVLWVFPLPDPRGDEGLVFDAHHRTALARGEWRTRSELAQATGPAEVADARVGLGLLRMFGGDYPAGHAHLTKAARLYQADPNRDDRDVASVESNLAICCERLGRFAEAERHHAAARRANIRLGRDGPGERVRRMSTLARLYADAGRGTWAEVLARRVIALEPAAGRSPQDVARVYFRPGRLDEARWELDVADRLAVSSRDGIEKFLLILQK